MESVGHCFLISFENTQIQILKGINLLNCIYGEFERMVENEHVYVLHYFLYHAYQIYLR